MIYAAPQGGAPLAYLVANPLPLSFSIAADTVTTISPEVLSTEAAIPEDFGYSSFGLGPGGLWFGSGGGSADDHVFSLNYHSYCAPGGIDFSDASDSTLGNVVCGQPGAVYFKC